MAKRHHKARARPAVSSRKPTSPLCRPYWTFEATGKFKHHLPASCLTLALAMETLICLLANSEAFRVLQDSCDGTDPTYVPLTPEFTEGVFAALYMLSQQTVQGCSDMAVHAGLEE